MNAAPTERPAFESAKDQQWTWKTDGMRAYAVAFVRAAVGSQDRGEPCFGPDDLPEHEHPEGNGMAGSVISGLLRAHVVEPFYGSLPELGIHGGRRNSRSEKRNAAKVQTYRLVSRPLAEAFLRRHGAVFAQVQPTFTFMAEVRSCA